MIGRLATAKVLASRKAKQVQYETDIMVAVRIRPISDSEIAIGCSEIISVVEDNMVCLLDPLDNEDDILRANRSREKTFVFDQSFGPDATQEEVYKGTTMDLVQSVLEGYNATVFAYGPTGAGKTFTMLGVDNEPGIMVLTLNNLYRQMEKSRDTKYKVKMSYLEIYNEMIRDLLNPGLGYLDLREDSKGVQIAGLSEYEALTTNQVMNMLSRGNKERMCEPTAVNKTSSRSHAILQVTVEQQSTMRSLAEEIKIGKLFMIDLAGSERASQTQNRGKRLIEGAHINRSLLALGNCINALTDKKGGSYVNYRDSKLTRLLKDSLGGNCKTVMIAHLSPASYNFEESRNTLTYADRAKSIKLKAKRNSYNVNYHVAQYQNIISDLRQEIIRMKTQMVEVGTDTRQRSTQSPSRSAQAMNRIKQDLNNSFQEQLATRKELIDLDDSYLQYTLEYEKHLATIEEWQHSAKFRAARDVTHDSKGRRATKSMFLPVQSKFTEPTNIIEARKEMENIVNIQEEINDRKSQILYNLEKYKKDKQLIEETISIKVTNEQQREILKQICRIHEYQIKNVELESVNLMYEFLTRQKEIVTKRDVKRQKLVKEIVQLQKKLITDSNIDYPFDLDELYRLYQDQIKKDNTMATTLSIDAKRIGTKVPSLPSISIPSLTNGETDNKVATRRKSNWTINNNTSYHDVNNNTSYRDENEARSLQDAVQNLPSSYNTRSKKDSLNRHETFVYKDDGSTVPDTGSTTSLQSKTTTKSEKYKEITPKNKTRTSSIEMNDTSSLCSLQTVGISYDKRKDEFAERKRSASAGLVREKKAVNKSERKKRIITKMNSDRINDKKATWNSNFKKTDKEQIGNPLTVTYLHTGATNHQRTNPQRSRGFTTEPFPSTRSTNTNFINNKNNNFISNLNNTTSDNNKTSSNNSYFSNKTTSNNSYFNKKDRTKPAANRWHQESNGLFPQDTGSLLSISGTSFTPRPTQPGFARM